MTNDEKVSRAITKQLADSGLLKELRQDGWLSYG